MRIDFYHLKTKMIEQVLPSLAEKSLELGRVLMRVPSNEQAEYFDKFLWSYKDEGWIPHTTGNSSEAALQPLLITDTEENLNNATILFIVSNVDADIRKLFNENKFNRVLIIFSDSDIMAKETARSLWSITTELGCERNYWKL